MEERNSTKKKTPKKAKNHQYRSIAQRCQTLPDATQEKRAARIGVTQSVICKALRRLKISRKKTLHHPQAGEQKRQHFKEELTAYTEEGYIAKQLHDSYKL